MTGATLAQGLRRPVVLSALAGLLCVSAVLYVSRAFAVFDAPFTDDYLRHATAAVFSRPLADAHLRFLTSSPHASATDFTDRVGPSRHLVLGTMHDVDPALDDLAWVDSGTRQPFTDVFTRWSNTNVALARLPAGAPYQAVAITRGVSNQYWDEQAQADLKNTTLVGFFASYDRDAAAWRRVPETEPYILELPVWKVFPRPIPTRVFDGPEDARLLWSDAGELLVVYGSSSQLAGRVRAAAVVDLRAAWPAFDELMRPYGVPLVLDSPVEVARVEGQGLMEKNWAPFFAGAAPRRASQPGRLPLFHTDLVPKTVLEVLPDGHIIASYALASPLEASEPAGRWHTATECLTAAFPGYRPGEMHHATGFSRVTMCARGACMPSRENTVLLGVAHLKTSLRTYQRFFMTMSPEPPYELISTSLEVHFGDASLDDGVVFADGLTFFPAERTADGTSREHFAPDPSGAPGGELGHGWLDDILVVNAGLHDQFNVAFHMPVEDALRGHTLCL